MARHQMSLLKVERWNLLAVRTQNTLQTLTHTHNSCIHRHVPVINTFCVLCNGFQYVVCFYRSKLAMSLDEAASRAEVDSNGGHSSTSRTPRTRRRQHSVSPTPSFPTHSPRTPTQGLYDVVFFFQFISTDLVEFRRET